MSEKLNNIYYDATDYGFLSHGLGFSDANRDGVVTSRELAAKDNAFFRDFYATSLSSAEKSILSGYTATHPLTAAAFATDERLDDIAFKQIAFRARHEIITGKGLSDQLDTNALNFDISQNSSHIFDRVTINQDDLKTRLAPATWQLLIKGDLSGFKTNTLKILRAFLNANSDKPAFFITYDVWEQTYDRMIGKNAIDSADATWNELLLIWQKSDTESHIVADVADWVHGVVDGGIARVGKPDLTITAAGINRYLKSPREYVLPHHPAPSSHPASPLRSATARLTTTLNPKSGSRVPLMSELGVAVNLDIAKGATLTATQEVREGDLNFYAGKPLVQMSGFSLNVDADSGFTRKATALADLFLSLFGKSFDIETLTGVAVTWFHNRLCLIVQGECDNDADLAKPLGCDYLFFDIGFLVKSYLDKADPSRKLSATFFDAQGNVYSHVAVADLQDAIIKALANATNTTLPVGRPFNGIRLELAAQDINADFSGVLANLGTDFVATNLGATTAPGVTHLSVEDGRIYAAGTLPDKFTAQGAFTLNLALQGKTNSSATALELPITFNCDIAKRAGYARITLPQKFLNAAGLGGAYDGEILLGLSLATDDILDDGTLSTEKLLAAINAQALVSLKRDHADFLVAALELERLSKDPSSLAIEELVAKYDLAIAGQSLYGVVQNGKLSVISHRDDNLYLSHKIEVTAEDSVIGGMVSLFGKNASLAIYRDATGTYHIRPVAASLAVTNPQRVNASALSGEIALTPPRDGGRKWRIDMQDVAISVADAEIVLNGAVVRGETKASLSGIWTTEATDLAALFKFGAGWKGSGTLKLDTKSSRVKVTTSDKTNVTSQADRLNATIKLESLSFDPIAATGSADGGIRGGHIAIDTPFVSIESDVSGKVSAKGRAPLVRFVAKDAGQVTMMPPPALAAPELGDNIIDPDFDESAYLDALLGPLIAQIRGTPSSQTGTSFFVSRDFPYEAFADSVNDATFSVGKLPLSLDADYKKSRGTGEREIIRYPLFSGLLAFLNPQIERGSFLTTAESQTVVDDGILQEFHVDLSKPIRFLGSKITGIGIADKKAPFTDKTRRHLFLFTEHGRIDLMALLRLRYPCKIAALYRNLRKQGMTLAPNEIPRDFTDVAKYLVEILKVFDIDTAIKESEDHQTRALDAAEFDGLDRTNAAKMRQAFTALELPQGPPVSARKSDLLSYANTAAKDPNFAESVKRHFDLFAPSDVGWAEDYVDEIDLLKFEHQESGLSPDDVARIQQNNYLIVHAFVAQFLPRTDTLDFKHAENLHIELPDARPKAANYGIVNIKKDAAEPIAISLDYNPTDTKEHREHPGAYLNFASGASDTIRDVDFTYKTPTLWFKADFNAVDGLLYYIGRSAPDHAADFTVALDGYDAQNVAVTYMPPAPFNRPAFSLFVPQNIASGVGNRFVGSALSFKQVSDDLTVDVGIDHGHAEETFLYFYLGDTGKERDFLIDASQATFTDVTATVQNDYTKATDSEVLTFKNVSGNIGIDALPDGKPRALIFLDTTDTGVRRYLILNDLEARGRFDVEDNALTLNAHVGFLATLPDSIYESPQARALNAKGIDFRLDAVRLDGTMELVINETKAGFTAATGIPVSPPLTPTASPQVDSDAPPHVHQDQITLTLMGSFRFRAGNSWVTFTNLSVPLDAFMLKIISEKGFNAESLSRVFLDSLRIPAGRELTAGINAQADTAPNAPGGEFKINDGALTLSVDTPFALSMNGPDDAGFATSGAHLRIIDTQNRIDLRTGEISYQDEVGTIKNWKLDADVKDQFYQLLVDVLLKGKELDFQLK